MPRLTAFVRAWLLSLALACAVGALAAEHGYEVWALDQGTNKIYIITPDLQVSEVIALPDEIDMPHMIDFTSDYAYAFIANPASANTAVIRTADRQMVAILPTGAGSHFAGVVPGDERVIVDVIDEAKLVEISLDLDNERFAISRELVVAEDPLFASRAGEFPGSKPICHDYTLDGRYAYITLGPALANAGLVILDTESFSFVHVFPPSEVRTNCGTIVSPDGRHMFLNGGSVEEGIWYVFDTETHALVHEDTSRGTDAHGVWFTPDGRELWMVNRHSSNAIIIDPQTFEVIDEIAFTGKSPDILTASPDGRYMFITLRGPEQRSGPHAIAGDTPGVAVFDIAARELVTILEPDQGNPKSDFHGIGLRVIGP
jgi:DNA-binding beta-propeller fold protein YncE